VSGTPFEFVVYILEHREKFLELLRQHVELTVASVALAVVVALPLAILASRVRPLAGPMTWLAGVGQTIPSLAVLGLVLPVLGIGFAPALFALTIRAILPIFLNAYVGIRGVDRAVIDAARGMGMSGGQRLLLVELPLAVPVIFAGVQTATVQNVAIATLAAFIGGGGLGDLILQGLDMVDTPVLLAGAVPLALMAMLADVVMRRVGRLVAPAGLRATTT
jgi:osmoprotectant transport system permease protein